MPRLKSAGLEAGTFSTSGGTVEPSPGLLPGAGDSPSKFDICGSRVACAEIATASAKCFEQLKVDMTKIPFSRVCRIASSPSRLARSMEAMAWGNAATAQNRGAKQRNLIVLTIFRRSEE